MKQEIKSSNRVKFIFYLIMILIPILLIVGTEIGLRITNYGYNNDAFIQVAPGFLGSNPDYGKKFFKQVKRVPNTINDVFTLEKKNNSFRVFVIGGSSAAGFPYMPLGAFSRYIRQRLELSFPYSKIEVVNLGLTAVNSYTLLDLVPSIIEQKPDLILVYAGHNEYYGALGVGSLERTTRYRTLIKFMIWLEDFKIFQLVRNLMSSTVEMLSDKPEPTGTLMSRMAESKQIKFGDEVFNAGIEQFNENMSELIEIVQQAKIPILISTLASNLAGQSPFIPQEIDKKASASSIFNMAENELKKGNIQTADSLFRLAKDYDMLRFRAPELINQSIRNLAKINNIPLVEAENELTQNSELGIIGNDLMDDHLHPNLKGYQLIGKAFYEKMEEVDYLPKSPKFVFDRKNPHQFIVINYHFTQFDSIISSMKVKMLKNDWPFIDPKNKIDRHAFLQPKNKIDSLAYKFVEAQDDWEGIQRQAANYYLRKGEFQKYSEIMNVLIWQFPIIQSYYRFAIENLVLAKQYDLAYDFAIRKYSISPDAISAKWCGIINLNRGNNDLAIKYLTKNIELDGNDEQVYYNLAGAYVRKQDMENASLFADKAVLVNPKYQQAILMKRQLDTFKKMKNVRKNKTNSTRSW